MKEGIGCRDSCVALHKGVREMISARWVSCQGLFFFIFVLFEGDKRVRLNGWVGTGERLVEEGASSGVAKWGRKDYFF